MTEPAAYLQKVKELKLAGRDEDALLVLEHATRRHPNNLDFLHAYVELARVVVLRLGMEDAEPRWAALESFVRCHGLAVEFDKLNAVLSLANDLREHRTNQVQVQAQDLDVGRVTEADAPTAQVIADHINITPPQDAEALAKHLQILEQAREASNQDSEQAINDALGSALFARDFDRTDREISSLLELARSAAASRVAYVLQQAEALLRPFAVEMEKLDSHRRTRLDKLLTTLRTAGDAAAQRTRDDEAETKWREFEARSGREMESLRGWKTPELLYRDRGCTLRLEDARTIGQALQELLPSFLQTKVVKRVTDKMAEIQAIVGRLSEERQLRYNRWAIRQIEQGYGDGKKHLGVIDNEKELDDSMVSHFGAIDTRLLGAEVQRCYGEVFESLFQRLDSPDNAQDFEKRGTKLHALKAMMNATKCTLEDF